MGQLRLSVDGAISQRHLSFLESGRAQPSRELILQLGMVLDIPLRQRNVMLLAAGYARAYQERKLDEVGADGLHWIRRETMSRAAKQAPCWPS